MITPIQHAKNVISSVRQKTNRALLFYSGGKDSIVLLDLLANAFDEVVCVFMYFVKDLEHINKYIRFSENHYSNVKFIQVPHWNLTYIYRSGMYCVPNHKIRLLKLADIDEAIRIKTGINWTFYGMKKADSLNRRIMLMGYDQEAINQQTQKAYPLSIWKNGDVLRYIQLHKLPEPIIYGKKASNGVTFDLDVFLYLRKNYPDDLRKILKAFPMSAQILFEYDNKEKKQIRQRPAAKKPVG